MFRVNPAAEEGQQVCFGMSSIVQLSALGANMSLNVGGSRSAFSPGPSADCKACFLGYLASGNITVAVLENWCHKAVDHLAQFTRGYLSSCETMGEVDDSVTG